MQMSSKDLNNLQEIYESMYIVEMDSATVVGDSPNLQGGSIENGDTYNTGVNTKATLLGIQRRNKINQTFDPLKNQKKNGKLSNKNKNLKKVK